jgi:hypothetical protein
MSNSAKIRSRRKPERQVRLTMPIRDNLMGGVQITIGKVRHNYTILPIPSDFGVAFRLIKSELVRQPEGFYELKDTARYDVLLNGEQSTCECKGFLKHHRCKHVEGLTVLLQRGLI